MDVEVNKYVIHHWVGGKTLIQLGVEGGDYHGIPQIELDDLQEARFIIDVLRNEKPVYYNPDSQRLRSGEEPVGEEEWP